MNAVDRLNTATAYGDVLYDIAPAAVLAQAASELPPKEQGAARARAGRRRLQAASAEVLKQAKSGGCHCDPATAERVLETIRIVVVVIYKALQAAGKIDGDTGRAV